MGGKQIKIHTSFQPKKCGKRSFVADDDDRISRIPDEILVDILALLPLKEAARTSVLSSRWKNLWKHTPSLDFDAESVLQQIDGPNEKLESEKRKYVKWVNSVLQSHESLTLEEFRICFHLNKSSKKEITRWLDYAFSRQVQRLELDLSNYNDQWDDYCFADELLTRSSCEASKLQPLSDSVCTDHPRTLVDFKSLKELSFVCLCVSDEAIKFFVDNCPLLEKLIVIDSDITTNLEICGPSLMLKHLEITRCYGLESLKVCAPRLTTLTVLTFKGLLLGNVPMLVDVSIWRCYDDCLSMKNLFNVLSCCICQLQTLRLVVNSKYIAETDELCGLRKMPKLKKLVIDYCGTGDESLIRLAALIRVSPYLEEFDLKFHWRDFNDRQVTDVVIRSPHSHLKVFKFGGYYGRATDAELLGYILENCSALEKIIVDRSALLIPENMKLDVEQTARKNAEQQLRPLVPRHVELIIL